MKQRADVMLVERGLVETRARAQALILAGKVFAGERRVAKAGDLLAADAPLSVRGQDHPWVSRGGLKLAHALAHFELSPAGLACLDIGASTGGFTDVLLAHGAARVHAIDVGHGQLAWKLRSDPRVVVHERTNARHLTAALINRPDNVGRAAPPGSIGGQGSKIVPRLAAEAPEHGSPDASVDDRDPGPRPGQVRSETQPEHIGALVCDASFIGLATLLPAPLALCGPRAWAVALIKPQFEAGPGQVGSKGVVRDPAVHAAVCDRVRAWWEALGGWRILGVTESPITGPEGNREFLIAAVRYS